MGNVKVTLISIGNEILLGRTINTNLSYIAEKLAGLGLPLWQNSVIKDEADDIFNALNKFWAESDIIISTGGLGPTDDDITKQTIAEFFGKELTFHEDIWQQVQEMFARRGLHTPQINRCQAMVPDGFSVLQNLRGTAPGLLLEDSGKVMIALPGVPLEMKYIFETHLISYLQSRFSCQPIHQRDIHTSGVSESALAERLSDFKPREGVSLAWLPQTGRVDLRLYGTRLEDVEADTAELTGRMKDVIWAYDHETPYVALHKLMLEKRLTLSVAESCTGGLIQQKITDLEGASGYFLGGVVSYSNSLKEKILNVHEETLVKHGAVSAETATAMALGIKQLTNSELGISVTGIAGPDGGSNEKPVGTVFFAIAFRDEVHGFRQYFSGDRTSVRQKAADFIVLKLIKLIRGE